MNYISGFAAGWSSPVARQAHNLKVVGSNPTPAPKDQTPQASARGVFLCLVVSDWQTSGVVEPEL